MLNNGERKLRPLLILTDINLEETKSYMHEILLPDMAKSLEIGLRAQDNTLDFS
jgi:hypothetical protein